VVLFSQPDEIRARHAERGDPMYSLEHILKVNLSFYEMCHMSVVEVRSKWYRHRVDVFGSVTDPEHPVTAKAVCDAYCKRLAEYLEIS
jgi:hypothetical protein